MNPREHATQLRLVRESDQRETGTARHGSYAKRLNFDEARARLLLYPPSDRVSNVIPLRPRPTDPDAA